MTYVIWPILNALEQRHRQMRERFGHRQFMVIFIAIGPLSRANAPSSKNVTVTAREFIVHKDRRIAPGLGSDRLSRRQSDEKTRSDYYHSLIAEPPRKTDDMAFALARRVQRQIFPPLEKIAIVPAIIERAGGDKHLDPSV